ncbi:MAG TPA: hypothetical protein VFR17_04605 [Mycobacterium sp.]|nr:hypothetical protein [Mycobacterium sp.]
MTPAVARNLPDQGYTLARWAHDLAQGRGAAVVEAEVERIRRPDGVLAYADLSAFRKPADGPLSVLRRVLDLEADAVRRWGKRGFARFHRFAAGRRAERLCRQDGVAAAVDWLLANGSAERLPLDVLRRMLGAPLYRAGAFDEDFFRAELARCLDERRRQISG